LSGGVVAAAHVTHKDMELVS